MILISNIGNRNIRYKNQYFDRKLPAFASIPSFRAFTRDLLERFDTEKDQIEPQILPALFHHLETVPQRLILFYSDSPEGVWNEQDTVHEALILEKCFAQQYPGMEVQLMPLKCRVTDTNALMHRYRSYIRRILAEAAPDETFVLCDTGGTAQQKAALKIIFEFMVDDARYKVFNVNYTDNQSQVELTESIEYRTVISQEQILALIQTGNYRGALAIYNMNQHYNSSLLYKTLEIAAALFENNINRACTLSSEPCFGKKHYSKWSLVASIAEKTYYGTPDGRWLSSFTTDQLFDLKATLDIGRLCEANQQFGFAVLFHQIFIEQALSFALLTTRGTDIDDRQEWERTRKAIINGEWGPVASLAGRDWESIHSPTLPVKILLAESLGQEMLKPLTDSFKAINSVFLFQEKKNTTGLDTLRNKFAHEGKTIRQEDYTPFRLYSVVGILCCTWGRKRFSRI